MLRGTLSHAIRREFPTPHPISEFSSRTDKSASSPGCSSSAKLGDLADGSSCRARTAPRYGASFIMMRSRRPFSVSELQNKDLQRLRRLDRAMEGVRHDLHVRMRELFSKFEGVEAVDVGTLPRHRVRRENPDITSPPLTKRRSRQIFVTFPQVSRTARAEATSFVHETRENRCDLKGRPSHVTVRLRVLVQKLASVSSHWRRATCYYRQVT